MSDLPKNAPTREQWAALVGMFDHFNRELFAGELPEVILTSQGMRARMGFLHRIGGNKPVARRGPTRLASIQISYGVSP